MAKLFIQRQDDGTYLLGMEVKQETGMLETVWTEDIAEAICISLDSGTFKRPRAEFEKAAEILELAGYAVRVIEVKRLLV